MAEVDNTGERRATPEQNATETGERLLAETRAVTPAQPTEAVTPGTTAPTSDVNPPGVLARGADGVEIYDPQAERQRVGMDRAAEALESGRPTTIRVVGEQEARAVFELLRDRNGSIQITKEKYDVHRVPITSNSLVSSSESYIRTARETQATGPDGQQITIAAGTTLPAGTIIEADGRIRAAHPDDAGITVNGKLIPNGSMIGDRTALSGGQDAVPGQIIPARRITDLDGNRVVDAYPMAPERFARQFRDLGDGRFQFIADGKPVEHTQVPRNVNIEYFANATDTVPLHANNGGSFIRGTDHYGITESIFFNTWYKVVDVKNADKMLAMYEQRGLGNSEEARAMRTNRDAAANAESRSNIKTSALFTPEQIRAMADASVVVTPQEHAERMTAIAARDAKTAEERIAAERALAGGHAAQVKFLNGLKTTSGAAGGLVAIAGAAVTLAGGTEAQARPRVTFGVHQVPVR